MAHDHAHAPDHDHAHPEAGATARRLTQALIVISVFLVIEVVGGILTNSLALLADAGHMLTDVASLVIAVFAARLAKRPATPRMSFGLLRAEVIGAFVNGATLVAIVFWIFWEAVQRINHPPEVAGPLMLGIAAAGLVANIIAATILYGGHEHSINLHGAYLHVLGDTLGSIGAIIAAAIIWGTGWTLADPLVSMLIGGIILFSSIGLLKRAINILLNATPENIDYTAVKAALESHPHVTEVHDLHIWSISHGNPSLSAHLRLDAACSDADLWEACLRSSQDMLRERFGITHTTLQLEPATYKKDLRHY